MKNVTSTGTNIQTVRLGISTIANVAGFGRNTTITMETITTTMILTIMIMERITTTRIMAWIWNRTTWQLKSATCLPICKSKDLLSVGDVVPGHPNSFWYNDLFPCRFSNRPCDVGINDGEYEVMNLGPDLQTIKISLTGDVQAGEVWMVATDPNGQPVTVTRDSH
mmetsp:Transcript_32456/g.79105  ORF Transcript_32456/g.79105 Transcript_32456/m.79105 type:complete len:166 (-) Transcript_32456:1828-2325(-)